MSATSDFSGFDSPNDSKSSLKYTKAQNRKSGKRRLESSVNLGESRAVRMRLDPEVLRNGEKYPKLVQETRVDIRNRNYRKHRLQITT